MYIESSLHQQCYYTLGNTVQRKIIPLRGQWGEIKHVEECLCVLHLLWGVWACVRKEGGTRLLVYCFSETVFPGHAASHSMNWFTQQVFFVCIVLFYSFSFHCNLLQIKPSRMLLERCCSSPHSSLPGENGVCYEEQTERHKLIKAGDISK